jgi:hypothetical protein
MARFYTNENVPVQVVAELRRFGHDVMTSMEAGKANSAVPDKEVLAFAASGKRILVTLNRRHFLRLHQQRTEDHAGIVLYIRPRFSRAGAKNPRRHFRRSRYDQQAGPRESYWLIQGARSIHFRGMRVFRQLDRRLQSRADDRCILCNRPVGQ